MNTDKKNKKGRFASVFIRVHLWFQAFVAAAGFARAGFFMAGHDPDFRVFTSSSLIFFRQASCSPGAYWPGRQWNE